MGREEPFMKALFRASMAVLVVSLATAALAAEGTASGTLTANGKAAPVKLAQAWKTPEGWTVVISDAAIPEEEYETVQAGKLHLLTLEIDTKGQLLSWKMGHGALQGGYLSTAQADLKTTKLGPVSVEGTVKKAKDSFGSNTVAFDVTFKAPVVVDKN